MQFEVCTIIVHLPNHNTPIIAPCFGAGEFLNSKKFHSTKIEKIDEASTEELLRVDRGSRREEVCGHNEMQSLLS
jgi:hypothetical protein